MLLSPLLGVFLASLAPTAYSQLPLAQATQLLIGTWSSGSRNVVTGAGFANPANMSFSYPKTTGISYSFSDDFYEVARYRYNGNGSEPTCITGVIGWSHGKYQLNPNGSMTLFPFPDGYQQIQDPCAAVSENFIEDYQIKQELYQNWVIFQDPSDGLKLHMFAFDRAPLAPQFKVSDTPMMLPTQPLRNVTDPAAQPTSTVQRRSVSSAASKRWSGMAGVTGVVVVAFASLVF